MKTLYLLLLSGYFSALQIDFKKASPIGITGNFAGISVIKPSSVRPNFDRSNITITRQTLNSLEAIGTLSRGFQTIEICELETHSETFVFVAGVLPEGGQRFKSHVLKYSLVTKEWIKTGREFDFLISGMVCYNNTVIIVGNEKDSSLNKGSSDLGRSRFYIWDESTQNWSKPTFDGFNGPVNTFKQSGDDSFIVGGLFDKTIDGQENLASDFNLVDMAYAKITDAIFNENSNKNNEFKELACSKENEVAKFSGFLNFEFPFKFNLTGIMIQNGYTETTGIRKFSLLNRDTNQALELYKSTENGAYEKCSDCELDIDNSEVKFILKNSIEISKIFFRPLEFNRNMALTNIAFYTTDISAFIKPLLTYNNCKQNTIQLSNGWNTNNYGNVESNYLYSMANEKAEAKLSLKVPKDGNYKIYLKLPCKLGSCPYKGDIDIQITAKNKIDPIKISFDNSNPESDMILVYQGLLIIDKNRVTISFTPTDVAKSIMLDRLVVTKEHSAGQLNGLIEFKQSFLHLENHIQNYKKFDLKDNFNTKSISVEKDHIYVAGTALNTQEYNVYRIKNEKPELIITVNNGLLTSVASFDKDVYITGDFKADRITNIALFKDSDKRTYDSDALYPLEASPTSILRRVNDELVIIYKNLSMKNDKKPFDFLVFNTKTRSLIDVPYFDGDIDFVSSTYNRQTKQNSFYYVGRYNSYYDLKTTGYTTIDSEGKLVTESKTINEINLISSIDINIGAYYTQDPYVPAVYNFSNTISVVGGTKRSQKELVSDILIYSKSWTSTDSALKGKIKSLMFAGSYLIVGGDFSSRHGTRGMAVWSLGNNMWERSIPLIHENPNYRINKIIRYQNSSNILVAGSFSTDDIIQCSNLCLIDGDLLTWINFNIKVNYEVLDIVIDENKMYTLTNETDANIKRVKIYDLSSNEVVDFPKKLPGPATKLLKYLRQPGIYIIGKNEEKNTYIHFWNDTRLQSVNLPFTTNSSLTLDILPALNAKTKSLVKRDEEPNYVPKVNTVMVLSGNVEIEGRSYSSIVYDGNTWEPFLSTDTDREDSNSNNLLTFNRHYYYPKTKEYLPLPLVILISLGISFSIIFIIIFIGLLFIYLQQKQNKNPYGKIDIKKFVPQDPEDEKLLLSSQDSLFLNEYVDSSFDKSLNRSASCPKEIRKHNSNGSLKSVKSEIVQIKAKVIPIQEQFTKELESKIKNFPISSDQIDNSGIYKAKFDFNPQKSTEIGFRAGQSIYVLDDEDKDWWLGFIKDENDRPKKGIFPSSHVERII